MQLVMFCLIEKTYAITANGKSFEVSILLLNSIWI